MNARLYNPRIGRFFSPDNYITDPENPQNYNRYSYALNNPLSYVDPSGNSAYSPYNEPFDGTACGFGDNVLDIMGGAYSEWADAALTGSMEDYVFGYSNYLAAVAHQIPGNKGGGGGNNNLNNDDEADAYSCRTGEVIVEADRIYDDDTPWYESVWNGIKSVGDWIWSGIKSAGEWLWNGIKDVGKYLADNWQYFIPVWGNLKAADENWQRGEYGQWALNCGMAAVETVTLVGGISRRILARAIATESTAVWEIQASKQLTAQQARTVRSLEKNIAEHLQKLQEYTKDPWKFDNLGYLKNNANNPEIQNKIIQTRINHLKTEIKNWQEEILKIKGKKK